MDELFSKYERELVVLRSLCREYGQRYPKVAAKLQLGGEACDDPHVERLIQAVALLCARVTKRLDDSYPQFTEALLNLLFPHYLRPFPSCAIVRIAARGDGPIKALPRGSRLETRNVKGIPCTFTTAYEVLPPTTVLAGARFDAMIFAPPAMRLPAGASSSVSLTFAHAQANAPLAADQSTLRLFVDGDPSFCATLRDALFMRTACACVQFGDDAPWIRLPCVPLAQVGFAEEDALIPFGARSHVAYRLLAEYFAFPDKFNFIDIDLAAVLARAPHGATRATLHLVLTGMRADDDQARLLAGLSPDNLLQGCTPVVNLFRQPGVPISFDQLSADYTVLAHGAHPQAFEVYSVDRVHMLQQTGNAAALSEFRPFYSLRHAEEEAQQGRYWLMRHDETLALCSPGHEKSISLVDAHNDAFEVDRSVLSIELTCTNRDLPCSLKLGALDGAGDLFAAGATDGDLIRFMRRPTRPARLVNGADTHWRLISHLALNHHSLVQDGAALREMLSLYDLAQSAVTRRQIGGIAAVESVDTTAWIRHKRGSSLVHGTEVRLHVDEDAFIGAGVHLFALILEQFFGMVVHINSFVELVILSRQSGKELLRCQPRSGNLNLV